MIIATMGLVGAVIVIAALLSGAIERTKFPQVAVFLLVGAILGPLGLTLIDVTLQSPILQVVAILSLVLVLFTDAVSLDVPEVRKHTGLALLLLGPGTVLSAGLMAVAAVYLLGLSWSAAAILGAALASTDPVMLRGLLKRDDLPAPARQALRLESSLNDAVLLPIVFVAMAFATQNGSPNWGPLALKLFILGPIAGIVVGFVAVSLLEFVRRKMGVRRDYESLYSLGVALAAYAAAEAFHGSGFLAAFFAGLTIAVLDVELCDCFLEYGETTAEMALLFTFVLFGTSLIWRGAQILDSHTILFALLCFAVRPVVYLLALARTRIDGHSKFLIAWFGPRGLSSLLLILLPVFAGVPGSERLFAICSLVVLISIVVHGGSLMFVHTKKKDRSTPEPSAEPTKPEPAVSSVATDLIRDSERISVDELIQLQQTGEPLVILDVRSDRTYDSSNLHATGAIRVHPDHALEEVSRRKIDKDTWVITFCA